MGLILYSIFVQKIIIFRYLCHSFALAFCLFSLPAEARVFIDVGKAKVKKAIVSFPTPLFTKGNEAEKKQAQSLHQIIKTDLANSGFFDFISADAYLGVTNWLSLNVEKEKEPEWGNWQSLGSDFLIKAKVTLQKETKKLSLTVRLYYVPEKKTVFLKKYEGFDSIKMAHVSSGEIVEKLTGKKSVFRTRFVFSRRKKITSKKEIFTINWDGRGLKRISRPTNLSFSPAWSPDGTNILYTAFVFHKRLRVSNADLFTYNLDAKRTKLVSYRKGTNSGGTFHPDGQHIVFSLSRVGSSDLKLINMEGKMLRAITRGPVGANNISPAISPDGKRMAFVSDRSGRPMIYVMDMSGANVKRLTFSGKYNASPTWSPDGKFIAFASFHKGAFDIFSIDINGNNLKKLTRSYKKDGQPAHSENPSFSPDGRHIVFNNNRTGKNQLYVMLSDGKEERRITFDDYDNSQPFWSPYLK